MNRKEELLNKARERRKAKNNRGAARALSELTQLKREVAQLKQQIKG